MRLRSDIQDLYIFNRCQNDYCYNEPFERGSDIYIHDQLPSSVTSFSSIKVEVLDIDAVTFIADISADVNYIIGKDINGNAYYTLQLDDAANIPSCFLLRITVSGVAYVKYTEPYERLGIGCYGGAATTLEGVNICYDMEGNYYGDARDIIKKVGTTKFTSRTIIRGKLKRSATDIKRTISEYGCRSIRTDFARLYALQGYDVYPEWKMNEIENIFASQQIKVGGETFYFRGGSIFTEEKIKCSCGFLLNAKLEDCSITREYGCEVDCTFSCTYYVITSQYKDQMYYDDKGDLIAVTFYDLLSYFHGLADVNSAVEVPLTGLECQVLGVIKVDTNGILPSFLYYNEVANSKKIFAQLGDCSSFDVCANQPEKCVTGEFTGEFINECITPDIAGGFDGGANTCTIEAFEDWSIIDEDITTTANNIQLELTAINATYAGGDPADIVAEYIGTISENCWPSVDLLIDANSQLFGAMPAGGKVYVYANGTVLYVGVPSSVDGTDLRIYLNINYNF